MLMHFINFRRSVLQISQFEDEAETLGEVHAFSKGAICEIRPEFKFRVWSPAYRATSSMDN